VFENRFLRRMFGPKREEGTENGKDFIMKNIIIGFSPCVLR
jgi:hypothetical protein